MSSPMKVDSAQVSNECKLTCDYEILRKSPIFEGADSEVVKLFAYLAERKVYQPGKLILQQGEDAKTAFYLVSGEAEISCWHQDKEVVLQKVGPGTFCGELALLARFKWFFNVRSTEESKLLSISRDSFLKVLDKFPEKREKLIERIVQLRVQRLAEQTHFMLEKLPETLLNEWVWAPSKLSI